MKTKTPAQMNKGDHVIGLYFNRPFAGTIESSRANTANYRETLLFVNLDRPLTCEYPAFSDGICLTVREDGFDDTGTCRVQADLDSDYWPLCDRNTYPRDTAIYTAENDPFAVNDPVESYFEDGALYLNLEADLDVTERARFARGLLLHNNHLKTCEWQIGLHTGTSFAITFRHVLALDADRAQIKAFALDFLGNLQTTRAIPPAVQPSLF